MDPDQDKILMAVKEKKKNSWLFSQLLDYTVKKKMLSVLLLVIIIILLTQTST